MQVFHAINSVRHCESVSRTESLQATEHSCATVFLGARSTREIYFVFVYLISKSRKSNFCFTFFKSNFPRL